MSKKTFDVIKKESVYAGILFLVILIIFKIIYFRDDFIVLLRFAASLFWLFAVPGYCLMLYWNENLDFTERIIIGIAVSAAVIGISSYYIGLLGLNLKYHGIILPFVLIFAGIALNFRK